MAFFTPATSLEARSASDATTAAAAAAAAQRVMKKLLSPNIVVVGCINEDTTVEVPRLPAPGETVLGREIRTSYGGKGANQAVQAALLLPPPARVGAATTEARTAAAEAQQQQPARSREQELLKKKEVEEQEAAGVGAAAVRKVTGATEKAAQTAKAAGEGVVSAVESWVSQLRKGPASSTAEGAQVAEGQGEQLLLEKAPAGGNVALICKLGDDEAGSRYRKYLAEKCIEQTGSFTAIRGKPTGRAIITVSLEDAGENTIAYVPGANEHLTQADIQQPHIVSLLQQAQVVVCENGVRGGVTVEALRLAKAAPDDVLTIFTPSPVDGVPREAFAYADYVVVNAVEAQQLYEQLVPLPRVRDSAGHVFEEQQREEEQRQKEREWPSLYATAARRPAKAGEGREAGRGAAAEAAGGAVAVTGAVTGKLPSPLALRERLRAVGTHAVEIQPAAPAAEALAHAAAAAAAAAGRAEASVAAREEKTAGGAPAGAQTREAGAAAAQPQPRAGDASAAPPPPAAAADLSEAALSLSVPETKAKESVPPHCRAESRQRRGKCDIIITEGSRGCTVTNGSEVLHVSPKRVVQQHEIVDTVGAGDAFVGALAYFLGHERTNLKEAVEKAGAVASYSIQRRGASESYADRATLGEEFFKS